MDEVWRTVAGYDGRYEVSNLGNVRSHYNGRTKMLKPMISAGKYNGYAMVTLYAAPNIGRKVKVHRLVAEAFIPNPDNLPIINHKDEDRTNNSVDNLEWCTKAYNNAYNGAYERRQKTKQRGKQRLDRFFQSV